MTECKWFSWNSKLNKYEVGIHGWENPSKWPNVNDFLNSLSKCEMGFVDEKSPVAQRERERDSERRLPLFSLIALSLYSRVSCKVPSWSSDSLGSYRIFLSYRVSCGYRCFSKAFGSSHAYRWVFQPVLRICILFVWFFFSYEELDRSRISAQECSLSTAVWLATGMIESHLPLLLRWSVSLSSFCSRSD